MMLDRWIASGRIPDILFRRGVRRQLKRHESSAQAAPAVLRQRLNTFIEGIKQEPVAIDEADANEQHYEVPTDFFLTVLGERLKYSSCLFPGERKYARPDTMLDRAEEAMLGLTAERAELAEGQNILELGCGWGSLSLYMAERFPGASITAVSNSRTQKDYIEARAHGKNLNNLEVITMNVADLDMPPRSFDRIVSIEMFEHMRNYPLFMRRLYPLLKEGGKMFVHIFSFLYSPYHFDKNDPRDWMARHFFAGGTMPSHELLPNCSGSFSLEKHWIVPGTHYGNTLRAWLIRMDRSKKELMPLFEEVYGDKAYGWWNNWRAFFIICEELFHFKRGHVWSVSHYLFSRESIQ